MKKVTRIFCAICMMGLLTFVSTSCKKNQENGEMTITVSMPSLEDEGDRAYINVYGTFFWHENDYIRVYNLADEANAAQSKTSVFSKIGNESVQLARFRGPSVGSKKAEGYRVFYPINMVPGTTKQIEDNLKNENRQVFSVSDHQQFSSYNITGVHHYSMVDPAAMPMAVRMEKLTDNANLHHMFGVAAFNINAGNMENIVVDSIMYEDLGFNITGEVSVKLHKVATDDTQGAEHNLNYVWNEFYTHYQGFTSDYVTTVLAPELQYLGWNVIGTPGNKITMDCTYEHEDGTVSGEVLGVAPTGTNFNFMLRPLAVSGGFNLTVYLHDGRVVELTDADFEYGLPDMPCDYSWGVKPGKRKTYIKSFPLLIQE
jgi:hypothetical protein